MIVKNFPSGPFETNAYVIACNKSRFAVAIDPAPESLEKIIGFLAQEKLKLVGIWLTHSHWDHIADVANLKAKFNVPISIHSLDAPNLEKPGSDGLPCWIDFEGVLPDVLLKDGDLCEVGHLRFKVIHTPGHTPGGVCFYSQAEKTLISGDTLFQGSIGNLSFPTSQPKLMWQSLDKLAKLPPETKVYPGHGPSTTIGAETWLPIAKQVFGS